MKCSISMVIKPNQFVQVRHDRLSVIVGNNLINRTTVREKKLYKINQIYLQFVLYYLIVIVYKSEVWKSPIDKISFTGVDSTRKFISLEWVHCYRNELNCVYNRSRGLSIRSMAVHYTRHGIRLRESNDSHSTHPRKRTLHPNVASRNLIICFTTSDNTHLGNVHRMCQTAMKFDVHTVILRSSEFDGIIRLQHIVVTRSV